MEPEIWGPPAWTFLHTITLNYPEYPTKQQKEIYENFFYLLGDVLPCEKCSTHYKENIKELPINLESKETLTKWLFDIHNKVNESKGKSLYKYDDFITKYTNMYDRNSKYKLIIVIIFLLLCFTLIQLYKTYK